MSNEALAVILLALAIAAVAFALYRAMPYRDQLSIEHVWKAPIP
jgi:hypothetical protein